MALGRCWCDMDGDRENAERYRQRAQSMRATATPISDPEMKKMLMGLADDYDRLAAWLDRIADSEQILKKSHFKQ